ncbi:MAG: TRAP transporter substrate-binding protein [Sulfurospirillaceae bacterium]|jgi:C4-dicarboxylate-binding protein DctP|nr:TRAP transporter substrate-binding protein [Sulfurospirillaceae bacterium]MDD2827191.1 TRAP transporter substrate-binding protein [Sulfurospirillaceae bacterium]MDD3342188.1 TRAP transporter substrate-binding protein [Sulfurospirillaceae bacterium]
MTKFLRVAAATALLVSSVIAAEYTIKLTHVVSPNTPKGMGADFFAKRVGELTAGKVEVIVFPNSQLYGDGEEMKALKLGNAHIAIPSFSKFTSIVPEMQIFDLPFLFRDKTHLHHVLDGEVGQAIKDKVTAKGFVALDYWDAGFKSLSANKPLIKPDDAAGLKFRIMSSHVLEAQFKAVGANPQVLPFSEVYSALQQGVVDGAENPLSNFYTKKFNEVQTDLTMTEHGYLGYLVVMSESFWKKFPATYKPLIIQAMKEATEYERKIASEDDDATMAKIKEYAKTSGKLTIHTLTPEQKAVWQKAMESIYPQFYNTIGNGLIKKAQAVQ